MLELKLEKKLDDYNFRMEIRCARKEILMISGESGTGKTTLLRMISGLENPDSGFIKLNKRLLFSKKDSINLRPGKRRISYTFQESTLIPNWSVEKNILHFTKSRSFALRLMEDLNILQLKKRKPSQISGGQRQRTAIAQSIAAMPDLILLDEPFSALDPENRRKTAMVILSSVKKIGSPAIIVSHDRPYKEVQELSFAEMNYGILSYPGEMTEMNIFESGQKVS